MSGFVIVVSVIWISSAIATITTKDSDCLVLALFATVVLGFGKLLLS